MKRWLVHLHHIIELLLLFTMYKVVLCIYFYHWPRPHEGDNTLWIGYMWHPDITTHAGIFGDCSHAFAATLIQQNYWGSQYVIMIYYQINMGMIYILAIREE